MKVARTGFCIKSFDWKFWISLFAMQKSISFSKPLNDFSYRYQSVAHYKAIIGAIRIPRCTSRAAQAIVHTAREKEKSLNHVGEIWVR